MGFARLSPPASSGQTSMSNYVFLAAHCREIAERREKKNKIIFFYSRLSTRLQIDFFFPNLKRYIFSKFFLLIAETFITAIKSRCNK